MQTALSSAALSTAAAMSSKQVTRSPALRLRYDSAHAETSPAYEITEAIEGDHLAIQGFLHRTLHRSPSEFASLTARPGYRPAERLLIRRPSDRTLTAHVQAEPQVLRFGHVELLTMRVRDLAVLAEYRHRGFDCRLITCLERIAKDEGAMVMVSRGEEYPLLIKHAWSSIGGDPVSMVSPQRLLGQLPPPVEPESPFYGRQVPIPEVRIARLTDLASLQEVYEKHSERSHGTIVRSADYWSWLLTRGAHDRIYMCFEDGEPLTYVVVRGASVLELIDLTTDGRGAARLLEHVGADAIEQGRHSLRIYAPVTERVHEWADRAGGQLFATAVEDSWMVKILSLRKLIRRLAPELYCRAKSAGLSSDLSIRVAKEEFVIKRGVRSMRIVRGNSRHHVGLTSRAAAQLLLGYRSADELAESRQLVASSEKAMLAARTLFPTLNIWRNKWDDVPALH